MRWTPAAVTDLEQIGNYLREHNPSLAQVHANWVVSPLPYIIVYQVAAETVHITRVLHGAQDWRKRFAVN